MRFILLYGRLRSCSLPTPPTATTTLLIKARCSLPPSRSFPLPSSAEAEECEAGMLSSPRSLGGEVAAPLKTMSLCLLQSRKAVPKCCRAPAPARARVLAHLAAAPRSSAAFKTLSRSRHVMLLQNQGWDPPVNQSPAPGWGNRGTGAFLTLLSSSRSCSRGSWPSFRMPAMPRGAVSSAHGSGSHPS